MFEDLTKVPLFLKLVALAIVGVPLVNDLVEGIKSRFPGVFYEDRTRLLAVAVSIGYAIAGWYFKMLTGPETEGFHPAFVTALFGILLAWKATGKHATDTARETPFVEPLELEAGELASWAAPSAEEIADVVVARIAARNGS